MGKGPCKAPIPGPSFVNEWPFVWVKSGSSSRNLASCRLRCRVHCITTIWLLLFFFVIFMGWGSPHMVWAHNKRWAGKAEGIEWPVAQMPWPNLFFLDAPFPYAKLAFGPHGGLSFVRAIPWSRESVLFANSAISSTLSSSIHKLLDSRDGSHTSFLGDRNTKGGDQLVANGLHKWQIYFVV